jgi:2-methylisocitrate lyase-like PEP mutase family enzyme
MSISFAALHRGPRPLLLPNAWDVPSALAFAAAGYPAIGTTSFGVSLGAGHPDGEGASRPANVALVAALAGRSFALSVDIEDGYSDDPEQVAAYTGGLDVDGINIEDSTAGKLIEPAAHAAKITAIKRHRPTMFVNARVDTFWLGQNATVEETVRRARIYADAGADGIFVPGTIDRAGLRMLADATDRPLNVLAVPGVPLEELGALGVRRVSTGSLPYRAALRAATEAAAAVRDGRPVPPAAGYDDLQRIVRAARS